MYVYNIRPAVLKFNEMVVNNGMHVFSIITFCYSEQQLFTRPNKKVLHMIS